MNQYQVGQIVEYVYAYTGREATDFETEKANGRRVLIGVIVEASEYAVTVGSTGFPVRMVRPLPRNHPVLQNIAGLLNTIQGEK